MAALLEFLLQHSTATDDERAAIRRAIADRVWDGPDLFFAGGPADTKGLRRVNLRDQAEQALAAILARVLARPEPPRATTLDAQRGRVEFNLEWLPGHEHQVDWPAIQIEARAEEAPSPAPPRQATLAQIDQCIAALDDDRPPGAPPLNRKDVRKLAVKWLLARGLTAKKEAIEERFKSVAHEHRRGTPGVRHR